MRHDLKLDQIHCTGSLEELKTPPVRTYVSLKELEVSKVSNGSH